MLNIMLINIALRPESRVKLFPIGIGYIATAMKNADFQFDLIDIDAHRYSDAEVDAFIRRKKYDVVAMGCIVTGYAKVKDLCRRVREIHPNACIVVGNSVATSIYETLLTKTEADVAVMGEGDITIVELLRAIDKGHDLSTVRGICYKHRGGIRNSQSSEILRSRRSKTSRLCRTSISRFSTRKFTSKMQKNRFLKTQP